MGPTGTWLDRGKLPGLFFLLLLLLLVPPPPLMVLPPDILRFRRLFGACLDGSAADRKGRDSRYLGHVTGQRQVAAIPTWRCHHPLPLLEEAGLEAVSGTKVVRLVSRHQFLHWLQNHTQLVEKAERQRYRQQVSAGGQRLRPSRGAQSKASWLRLDVTRTQM